MPVLATAPHRAATRIAHLGTPIPPRLRRREQRRAHRLGWAWLAERLAGGIAGLGADAATPSPSAGGGRVPGAGGAVALAGGASILDATRLSSFLPRMRVLAWPSEIVGAELGRPSCSAPGSRRWPQRACQPRAGGGRARGPGRLVLAGGMARLRLFAEILAGVAGRPLTVAAETDATATGAAACAALAGVARGAHRCGGRSGPPRRRDRAR